MLLTRTGSSTQASGAPRVEHRSRLLRLVAVFLVATIGLVSAGTWHAPNADARKKRDRTPTTIVDENLSATAGKTITNPTVSTSVRTRATATASVPGKSKPTAASKTSAAKPGNPGEVLVFPGAGKREQAPATIGSKSRPTLVASATPAASGTKSKVSAKSNRSDPRLRAIGFRSRDKLEQHYQKHGREFGNVTLEEYLAMAQDLRDAPLSDVVIEANQAGGTISRFDRKSGAFTAFDRDLTIRTFFKPNGGEDYFRRAATKTH